MDVTLADPFVPVSVNPGETVRYRVRLWTAPVVPNQAWLVDEWDVSGARDVNEVLAWADQVSATSFEIFLQWNDHVQDASGDVVAQRRFTRIFGEPADDGGITESVILLKDE